MKPATLVTLSGRPAVVTDASQQPFVRDVPCRVGANASHHPTRVVAHPSATNFEGKRPAGGGRGEESPRNARDPNKKKNKTNITSQSKS